MKGAKGGHRDRIISWLFSERTRKKREKDLDLDQTEDNKIDERRKSRTKNKKNSYEVVVEHAEETNISIEPNNSTIPTVSIEENELIDKSSTKNEKPKDGPRDVESNDQFDLTSIDVYNNSRDKSSKDKTQNTETGEIEEVEIEQSKDKQSIKTNEISSRNFIELEKPELIKISIIEEIETILRNDAHDLSDIQYRIDVLQKQEKDEVLIENVEKLQKELYDLIKRFNQIKNKYTDLYGYISVADMEFITGLGIGNLIKDYIHNGNNDFDNSNTINQIYEIKEFIEIINTIIEIEKKKDVATKDVEQKLVDFGIRDEEFIKLQDKYTNVEAINAKVEKYNIEIISTLLDIESKIANSLDISKKIETTTRLVPDLNKIMEATIMMASTKLIPPTPLGQLFKASLFISATHMMATAITSKTEQKEIITTTVNDYSNDISIGKDNIHSILNNIDAAFLEIAHMKDIFEKEFRQYAYYIPEYDKLIQNLFTMEKELTRQQYIAQDYNYRLDQSLQKNNQKIKILENE